MTSSTPKSTLPAWLLASKSSVAKFTSASRDLQASLADLETSSKAFDAKKAAADAVAPAAAAAAPPAAPGSPQARRRAAGGGRHPL